MKKFLFTLLSATAMMTATAGGNEIVAAGDDLISCNRDIKTSHDTVFVDLTISRKNMYASMGRVFENIPANAEVRIIEKGTAAVKQKDGSLSFVFLSMPTTEKTVISYALITKSPDVTIDGQLQYLYKNNKQNFEIPEENVKL